jgi:hypothetical protein
VNLAHPDDEQTLQEAKRLAQLRHPGIVAVHDVGIHDGQFFLVSEYVDGPDLRRWLIDHRPNWSKTVLVVAAVADALAYAHSRSGGHPRELYPLHGDVLAHIADGQLKLIQQFALDNQYLPFTASSVRVVLQAITRDGRNRWHRLHRRAFGGLELQMNDGS